MIHIQENSKKDGIILNQDHSEKHVEIPMKEIPSTAEKMLSKYLQFKENEQAVSPMVGIIMLTGITLIMSTVVLAIALSFQIPEVAPISFILASSEYDTIGVIDISISHQGGDGLGSGDWSVSVVPAGHSPTYKKSSTELTVGDRINTKIRTDGSGNYTVTRNTIQTDGVATPISVGRYDVSIIVHPYNAEIMHTTVQVNG